MCELNAHGCIICEDSNPCDELVCSDPVMIICWCCLERGVKGENIINTWKETEDEYIRMRLP